jgi:hypothetical protein
MELIIDSLWMVNNSIKCYYKKQSNRAITIAFDDF